MKGFHEYQKEINCLKKENLLLISTIVSQQKSISKKTNENTLLEREKMDAIKNYNNLFCGLINKENKIHSLKEEKKILENSIEGNCKKRRFNLQETRIAESIISDIEMNLTKLLNGGNYNKTKVKLLMKIQCKLGEIETMFYSSNFKLDKEILSILTPINSFFLKCHDFYSHGIDEFQSILSDVSIGNVKDKLIQLKYIIKFKAFWKRKEIIKNIETIYYDMVKFGCFKEEYKLNRFQKEIEYLSNNNQNLKSLIIERIFPGKTFGYLTKFIGLDYNYESLKTYGKYRYLYIFGSEKYKIFKIGITYMSLSSRFYRAKEIYQQKINGNDFNEIVVIKSLNAFRLEQYFKKKFSEFRHPGFDSEEWFQFDESLLKYFKDRDYLSDSNYQEINNYTIYNKGNEKVCL